MKTCWTDDQISSACQRVAHHFDWQWWGHTKAEVANERGGTAMFLAGYQPFTIPLELIMSFDELTQRLKNEWSQPGEAPHWLKHHYASKDVL